MKRPNCLEEQEFRIVMNKKLIVANWKMLPQSLAEAQEILEFTNDYLESLNDLSSADSSGGGREFSLVFCPPFVFIEEVAKIIKMSHLEHEAFLGAQDIATDDKRALTGDISGPMLAKLGIQYVIIGHSERRWKLGESDEVVNKKLKLALKNELIPIVCIGEKIKDKNSSKFLEEQVNKTFKDLTADEVGKCIIAYEPVWAISTNPGAKPDTPVSALESISTIKKVLTNNWPLATNHYLYGGSVNSSNVDGFLKEKEINGILVGGASVNKEEFVKILEMAHSIK